MGHRPLLAGIMAGIIWLKPAAADVKAITAVTRNLPAPLGIVLPELPAMDPTKFSPVSYSEPVRETPENSLKTHLDLSAYGLPCGTVITNRMLDEATYLFRVSDPCRPHEIVSFEVYGLRFDMKLSMTGETGFRLPGLANFAVLDTLFEDGEHHLTALSNIDLSNKVRIGVSWTNGLAPRLIARTFDVVTLGDGPARLQILSNDIVTDRAQIVRLTLQHNITPKTCDKTAKGHVFRQIGNAPPLRYDISLAPVSCARVGEILELKNTLEDLKLAAN